MFSDKPLLRVIKIIGSRQELIKLLRISGQRLNSWLNGDVVMGYEYAVVLEHLTCGQVTTAELVPEKVKILNMLKITTNQPLTWMTRKQMPIANIHLSECITNQTNDIDELANDIEQQNLLRPIAINPQQALIFGQRRLQACKLLGKSTIATMVLSLEGLLKDDDAGYQLKKYFTLSELAAIGIALEGMLGKRQGQRNHWSLRPNSDEVTGRTDELIARTLRLGGKTIYRQLKKVIQTNIRPLINGLDEEKISISAAAEITALSPEEQQQMMYSNYQFMMEKVNQVKTNKKELSKKTRELRRL